MALTGGEVAALGDQVAGLVEDWLPTRSAVDVRLVPPSADDPYRWSEAEVWTVYFDVSPAVGDTVVVRVAADSPSGWALWQLIDALSEYISDTTAYWGVAFPPCPGHRHPARVEPDGEVVALRCPQTHEIVQRVSPASG